MYVYVYYMIQGDILYLVKYKNLFVLPATNKYNVIPAAYIPGVHFPLLHDVLYYSHTAVYNYILEIQANKP